MIATAQFHAPPPDAGVTSLDLAEVLVERGVPFREAHHAVGSLVLSLVEDGRTFEDLTQEELIACHATLVPEDLDRLVPADSVAKRTTRGGGSMSSVLVQIVALRSRSV
jgi:argininosuccinate lyase